MDFSVVMSGLIATAPYLAAWIVAMVLAVIMLRRGGGKAERFLVAGVSLMLVNSLITVPMVGLPVWLHNQGMSRTSLATILSGVNLVRGLISLAGIVCLIYAYWVKFRVKYDT